MWMYGLLHEFFELMLLIGACAACLVVPRPKWAERAYDKLRSYFKQLV